jgi:hypothetical protein
MSSTSAKNYELNILQIFSMSSEMLDDSLKKLNVSPPELQIEKILLLLQNACSRNMIHPTEISIYLNLLFDVNIRKFTSEGDTPNIAFLKTFSLIESYRNSVAFSPVENHSPNDFSFQPSPRNNGSMFRNKDFRQIFPVSPNNLSASPTYKTPVIFKKVDQIDAPMRERSKKRSDITRLKLLEFY